MQLVGIVGYIKPVNVKFVLFTVNVIIVIVTSYLNLDIYIITNYGITIELFYCRGYIQTFPTGFDF